MTSPLDDPQPAVHVVWPRPEAWPLRRALAELGPEGAAAELDGLVRRLRTLDALAACPVVAVAGMLNAGKTSVVSRFLGEGGRARALRGLRAAEGTQRFVLWVPARWEGDAEVWEALHEHLREVFGASAERLSDDPATAHAQYRNAHTRSDLFGVPLLATDPALDAVGLAFLDCPDVQRRHGDADLSAERLRGVRLEVLGRAARLCSAFLVVATLDGIADRTLDAILGELAARAPGIRRFLLLNKLRPDLPPHEALAEVGDLVRERELAGVFGAWDHGLPGHARWSPAQGGVEGYPHLYRLAAAPSDNPPASDAAGRLLSDLPALLSAGALHAEKRRSLEVSLRTLRAAIAAHLDAVASARRDRTERAQRGVVAACRRSLLDPEGDLRVAVDQELLTAFLQSLERRAPGYVRVFTWLNRPLRALTGAVSRGLAAAREALAPWEGVKQRMVDGGHGGLVDADALVGALKAEDVDHELDLPDLPERCQRALDRFRAEHRARLDPAELDAVAEAVWAALPLWRKATAAGATLLGVVGGMVAVAMIPLDWGASVFYAASVKELLAVTVAGAAAGMALEVPLRAALERQAGWPTFADLAALLCDELGLPRSRLDGQPWRVRHAGGEAALPRPFVPEVPPRPPVVPVITVDEAWRRGVEGS